jgi:hypothetical protein
MARTIATTESFAKRRTVVGIIFNCERAEGLDRSSDIGP